MLNGEAITALISSPAQKCSPSPVNTTARILASFFIFLITLLSSTNIAKLKAFCFSSRCNVTVAIPCFFSNFIIMHSSDLLFELMFLLMLSKVDEDE